MNTRAFTLSMVIAGIAMLMVYSYISGKEAEFANKYGTPTSVVVAKKNIAALEIIDDSKVMMAQVPKKFVQPGSIRSIKDVENHVASVPVIKGEQITKPRVSPPNVSTGLSRQISAGKRAVSIQVDENTGVSKLIKPGDRVDVMAKLDLAGGRIDQVRIRTILQNAYVLSTGKEMSGTLPLVGIKTSREVKTLKLDTYSNYNTITLEVDPFQAQKLTWLLSKNTRLFLSLRNNNDKDIVRVGDTTIFDIIPEKGKQIKKLVNPRGPGGK